MVVKENTLDMVYGWDSQKMNEAVEYRPGEEIGRLPALQCPIPQAVVFP